MPPKPKVTKNEVAKMALAIVRKDGVATLTARELGKRLGVSSTPIFTIFKNMEEVKQSARNIAFNEFENYAGDFTGYTPAFKRIGMLMVSYAIHEPEMFKLLFMQEHSESQSFENTINDLGSVAKTCMSLIQKDYGLTEIEARGLFEAMWVQAFGMGAMCAMKVCDFTEEEIAKKLGQVFAGLVVVIKGGKYDSYFTEPDKGSAHTFHGKSVENLPYNTKEGEI